MKLKQIRKIENQTARCISLKNEEGLYITDNGIVTHNSMLSVLSQLFTSTHYAMMWHPYKFFGLSPATMFTQCLGGWNQKKASELLLEPFMNILESSPYFKRVRTHTDLLEASGDEIKDCLHYTTSTPTSVLQMQNGVNYKIINGPGAILGQSQPLDSKIYLPDGSYKLMGDLKVGDKIASPTEGEQTVLGIYPKGKKKTYKLTLSDGRTVRCSPDHLWKVAWEKDVNDKYIWQVKPLQFILDHPELDFEIWDKDVADDIHYIWRNS